ncbi:hypothetical protein BC831DRAFT_552065 [Entophlyctis helioformis]|nr:hypothetical protein BC831DRAFT_552065 [Entophlyctis helioformis]
MTFVGLLRAFKPPLQQPPLQQQTATAATTTAATTTAATTQFISGMLHVDFLSIFHPALVATAAISQPGSKAGWKAIIQPAFEQFMASLGSGHTIRFHVDGQLGDLGLKLVHNSRTNNMLHAAAKVLWHTFQRQQLQQAGSLSKFPVSSGYEPRDNNVSRLGHFRWGFLGVDAELGGFKEYFQSATYYADVDGQRVERTLNEHDKEKVGKAQLAISHAVKNHTELLDRLYIFFDPIRPDRAMSVVFKACVPSDPQSMENLKVTADRTARMPFGFEEAKAAHTTLHDLRNTVETVETRLLASTFLKFDKPAASTLHAANADNLNAAFSRQGSTDRQQSSAPVICYGCVIAVWDRFFIDSGATDHMTGDASKLSNIAFSRITRLPRMSFWYQGSPSTS